MAVTVTYRPGALCQLPLGSVKPSGWMRRQLEIQARGLTGHLEELWPDVGPESGWLGGNGEKWERGPYYCDGLVALAYLLDDKALQQKAAKWMEWSLNSQREDGFFGPADNTDWWPRFVMLKALITWAEATGDERVAPFMEKYFRYRLAHCEQAPLADWGKARSADELISMLWLYEKTGSETALELAACIIPQGIDWTGLFEDFPYKKPTPEYMSWPEVESQKLTLLQRQQLTPYFETHVVNVAMGLKHPAILHRLGFEGCEAAFLKGLDTIQKNHGVATGMFNGDEHLIGNSPVHGTELCAVDELMFSYEKVIEAFGASYGDLLEKIAFNAFPATITPEYTAHQYLQQVNQISATADKTHWYNNTCDANTFGLEPNFGCCTANMHQGWPRFAQSVWMRDSQDGGLAAVSYAPAAVRAEGFDFTVETDYPFHNSVRILVKENTQNKPMHLRIPRWCGQATAQLDGASLQAGEGEFCFTPKAGSVVELLLPAEPVVSHWAGNTHAVELGPLLMALPIAYTTEIRIERERFSDVALHPTSEWNYALELERPMQVTRYPVPPVPFSHEKPPVRLRVFGQKCTNWTLDAASAGAYPANPAFDGKEAEIELVPYGSTGLRIAQFLAVKQPE